MAKTKISEFSSTPGNNTDIDGINIAEGCAPSGINNAIRELMSQLKDWQAGTSNDPMVIGSTGSLTLSYGTANGVTYLNGSKVLTSGSALVFDGTNLGVGTSSTLGNSSVNAVLGFAARNSGATPAYFQTFNSNAGADLKTWRMGGDGSGNLVFETVNDAYSSSTNRMTLSSAGNLTLPAGTANGVAYLNGSKVLTTGSALTFDGTNLGVGVSSPSAPVDIQSNSGGTGIRVIGRASANAGAIRYFANDNTTQRARVESNDTGFEINSVANLPMYFNINNSEQMRLTSTGLGIGTSSPSAALQIQRAVPSFWMAETTSGTLHRVETTVSSAGVVNQNLNWNAGLSTRAFTWSQGGTENMRLDSSGNLGLGVTPSAWTTNFSVRALQLGGGSVYSYDNNRVFVGQNVAITGTGSDTYVNTAAASAYRQFQGSHAWYTAPSGTAGNAISFTQAMTLDASGNLGVGTTSPGSFGAGYITSQVTGTSGGGIFRATSTSIDFRFQADEAGSVGLINVASNHPLVFRTNSTERARIDSSGNLLIGATSGNSSNATTRLQVTYSSNTGPGLLIADTTIQNNSTFASFVAGTTRIGSVTANGTTAVLYNTTSDQRLKENIADADEASTLIDSLQVRQFDWKADGSHQRYGFVAQELATIAPEAVHQPADPEEMMAVDYSKLVPMLVKEIQSLRKRVAELEAK